MKSLELFSMMLAAGQAQLRSGFGLLRRRRRLVSPALLLAIGALLAVELGAIKRTETAFGPFNTEAAITGLPTESKMLFVRVAQDNPWKALLVPRGDHVHAQTVSTLKFYVNGVEYKIPHAAQDRIRKGETGVFAHWVKSVRFALPEGVDNGPQTRVQMTYALQLRSPWTTALLIAALGAILFFLERSSPITRFVLRAPAVGSVGLILGSAAAAALYASITLVAWADGWALPSTAAIIGSPIGKWFATAEPHFAEIALWLAALGLIFGWIAKAEDIDLSKDEARAGRLLSLLGFPVLLALLVFSASAQWSGLWRPGDLSAFAIAGLVPFSDPNGYWADANDVVKDGGFSSFSSRRPLAQVFRTTIAAAGGFNYAAMVIAQCAALAAAASFAALAAARRLGVWAGLGLAALACVTAREYVTTSFTEPIGYFWALVAIPFFVEAFRTHSLAHAVLAVAIFSLALWTRMGSMFTLPALMLWVALIFGEGLAGKLRSAALVCLSVLAVAGLNFGAAKLYARDVTLIGGNFSYTLCGISIGGIWSDCGRVYERETPKAALADEKAMHAFMYQKAFENIAADPTVAAQRLTDGSVRFIRTLPSTLTQGYIPVPALFPASATALFILSSIGLVRGARSISQGEWLFWILFWSSVILSAGFVFHDDGRRVMIAIYPLACLFLIRGWTVAGAGPDEAHPTRPLLMRARTGAAVVAAICLISMITPLFAHEFLRPPAYASKPADSAGDQFILGGRRVTGVLVVSDGEPRSKDMPTVLLSDFVRMIERSGLEIYYQRLVTPAPPPTPFALVQAPNLVPGEPTTHQYIAPPEILERRDVTAWRLRNAAPYGQIPGNFAYWLKPERIEPLTP